MAIHALQRGQLSRPQSKVNNITRFPAPIKGVDARIALTEGAPLNCIYAYNLVPFEYGMAVRKGYREWQIGVEDVDAFGVHTLIPFDGVVEDGSDDRLFAVTNEGIWDVSIPGDPPVLKFTFGDQRAEAGYGVYTHFVTDAAQDLLFYADNFNGLFQYDSVSDAWTQATGINGPVIENIRFIVVHKQRIWVVEEESTKAWYLPVRSISGDATEFFFGGKFKHGGNLEGLFNWSVDGGDGVDDYLVAVSRAGDVLPYQGADPSDQSWNLRGTYYIGEVPRGPFFGSEHGGELFLLSNYGITSMNDLLQGVDTSDLRPIEDQNTISGKITALLRARMEQTRNDYGWKVSTIPSEGGLLISTPRINNNAFIQYYYNFSTSSWGIWRGVPMETFDSYLGNVVFGDADNRVLYMDVTVDNVLLTPPDDKKNGDDIEFSVLTSYQTIGAEGLYKRVKFIRPDFLADGEPVYAVQARYDYDLAEALAIPATPIGLAGEWDISLWDTAVWGGGGELNPYNDVQGAWGPGRYVAVAMNGQTRNATRFVGWDVAFDVGGMLI